MVLGYHTFLRLYYVKKVHIENLLSLAIAERAALYHLFK
ncbi:hypothetical protein GXM_04777 [Nostoc sphaeroides CCNUC1]|uniref:Uncharacterized protein n=1 Tax=Nostoc sphaeroides CCNUC1 TaxID=2653204 RepID=A0A5P8W3G6_9NOSO|nr:hypothetical protein GXM_04777 [Nostoc sphaeroides CCNUC1]